MAYGTDVSVFVEDRTGDLGASGTPAPWWLSPDVDIPATPGQAVQGSANQVQIRVHSHEEPILEEKIVAEVYAGNPSLVLSPTSGTRRIDTGNLRFRPAGVSGTEPIASVAGGTLTFPWTPSASPNDVDGPGHRCLVVRAFPESVTPPTSPFDVPNEQHEAQRNVEVLATRNEPDEDGAGAGTPDDPRRRDRKTGQWSEQIATRAVGKTGRRFVVWALDPNPSRRVFAPIREAFAKAGLRGFAKQPPKLLAVEVGGRGESMTPRKLLSKHRRFVRRAGIGHGLFAEDRLLAAATMELKSRRRASQLRLRFDHSNLRSGMAVVLHGAQWAEDGTPEGGLTVIALAPVD